jgi:tRNA nucleotidyltransferase/poly(A) polymerase
MSDPAPLSATKSSREDALQVVLRLRKSGHIAYFAGGCVRDSLLGHDAKDFDVATDAPPARVQQLFRNTQAVGAAFGVILVRLGGSQIEVATFRAEAGYDDGRHPTQVRFTTAEEDARRRDFTINGLFFDPIDEKVIDYVGGEADLKNRTIRAIGNPAERFAEDSLRLLRAVRFSARLGFEIEPATASAIRYHAPELARISPERIADELRRMLTPATRAAAWRMVWELKLIDVIFRFLKVDRRPRDLSKPMLFPQVSTDQPINFGLALASALICYRLQVEATLGDVRDLFSDAEVAHAGRAMRQALKISNEERDAMAETLSGLAPLLKDQPPRIAMMKRFLAMPTHAESIALLEALKSLGHCELRANELLPTLTELSHGEVAPPPFITGDDLTALGLKPSPLFKRILDEVYDAQLESRIDGKAAAIAMAQSLAEVR